VRRAERAGALKLLDDPAAAVATQEIVPGGRSRWEIQRAIKVGAQGQRPRGVIALMMHSRRRHAPQEGAPQSAHIGCMLRLRCILWRVPQDGRHPARWLLALQL
jgi:hypothetical protein